MIYIDFETYSEVDIKKAGGKRYTEHSSTQLICMGYAIDDQPVNVWNLGKPETELFDIFNRIKSGEKVSAFNALFDWRIWNTVAVRDFQWPILSLEQMVDIQALCACYQLPQNLDDAGTVLNVRDKKLKAGNALIKLCCVPNKQGKQPFPDTVQMRRAFNDLFTYCRVDVEAMRQIAKKLPRQELIPQEQYIWLLTQEMNEEGLPIDYEAVVAIRKYLDKYIKNNVKQLPKITNGFISTPGQIAKIREWCSINGCELDNLQAATVEAILEEPNLLPEVKKVLEIRQEFGSSSVAKYKKIMHLAYKKNGQVRVHDNLRYHGSGTGRWAGQGFQLLNLPRAATDDPDALIDMFISQDPSIENPIHAAKTLIRPIIKAPPGYRILVADYKSIENCLLAWSAGDERALKLIKEGYSQYTDMAATRFNVPYEEVTEEQRRVGKVIILGAGYGMGWQKFKDTAKLQAGLNLTDEEAQISITAYREKYYKVKALWNGLREASVKAVVTGQKQTYIHTSFGVFKRNGLTWLAMLLPTGKALYYMSPTVRQELIPKYEHMGPVATVTHMGINPYSGKWNRLKLIPGRLTENYVQALAREVMAYGLLNIKSRMPYIKNLGCVHDEAVTLIPEEYVCAEAYNEFCANLCDVDFVPGCPIEANGYYSYRYKKG